MLKRTKNLENKTVSEKHKREGLCLFSLSFGGQITVHLTDGGSLSPQEFASCSFCRSPSSDPLLLSEACIEQSRPVRNPEARNKVTVALLSLHVCSGSRQRQKAMFGGSRWLGLLYISEHFNCKASWGCCITGPDRVTGQRQGPLEAKPVGCRLSSPKAGLEGRGQRLERRKG